MVGEGRQVDNEMKAGDRCSVNLSSTTLPRGGDTRIHHRHIIGELLDSTFDWFASPRFWIRSEVYIETPGK
jgi:hypothetical protein